MKNYHQPQLPLPAPLRGADIGSFAHNTIVVRLPDIARRTLADNAFPPDVVDNMNQLIEEIANGRIRAFRDGDDWDAYTAVYEGQDWLTPPWFFIETYFYRRILEAVGYFEADGYFGNGSMTGRDPFTHQKQHGLQATMNRIRDLAAQLNDWVKQGWDERIFSRLLAVDLWGNQADLSLWPADGDEKPDHTEAVSQQEHLLIDEMTAVTHHLTSNPKATRLDFIIDNAGFELAADLCLVDYLLSSDACQTVRFHLKTHPTFVSDAMIQDVHDTIAYLQNDSDVNVQALGERLGEYVEDGRLQLRTHPYWTSPLPGWKIPADLRDELAAAHLIISKGDANYRRLLGDRHWPLTTPFADVVSYLPAPLAALRTLKSDILVGLEPGRDVVLDQKDPDWQINGRWGLIQFVR